MNTPQNETQLINKKLVFSAHKSSVNYGSRLVIIITVKDSYFDSVKVEYGEGETFIAGGYSKEFEVIAYTDYRYVSYKENFANANTPTSEKTGFNYEYSTVGEEDPLFWEDEYLNDKEKWLRNEITVEDAKKMIKDIIDFYEPEDYDDPTDSFIKTLFEFIKNKIDSDEYRFEVKVEDIPGEQ